MGEGQLPVLKGYWANGVWIPIDTPHETKTRIVKTPSESWDNLKDYDWNNSDIPF